MKLPRPTPWIRVLLAASAAALALGLTGCRSGEDDLGGRPWNTPKSWESGLPSVLTEGR